jgi:hypothetical protein
MSRAAHPLLSRQGDKFHLVHIIPEPPTLHPWPGVYVPPDDALEREEVTAQLQADCQPAVVIGDGSTVLQQHGALGSCVVHAVQCVLFAQTSYGMDL